MILAQNWPKTAKSSWHCSFKKEKKETKLDMCTEFDIICCLLLCDMLFTYNLRRASMQLLWGYYSEPNTLQKNVSIFKEKFQPLCMKREYGEITSSYKRFLHGNTSGGN